MTGRIGLWSSRSWITRESYRREVVLRRPMGKQDAGKQTEAVAGGGQRRESWGRELLKAEPSQPYLYQLRHSEEVFGFCMVLVWFSDCLAIPTPLRVPRTFENVTLPSERSLTDVMRRGAEETYKRVRVRGGEE